MEESEKRKERLKAIRMEAVEADGDNTDEAQNSVESALGHGLANPLIESPSASEAEPKRPRFDYYTNPMAAFSQHCNTPPKPMDAGAQGNYTSGRRPYQPQGVNAIPLGIHGKTSSICTTSGNSSNTWDSSLGTTSNNFPPNSPQISDISSDGFPQGGGAGSQCGQGSPYRGSDFKGSPHQGSGRGKGQFKFYYNKSMVEDPWKLLKPVIWKPHGDTRDSLKCWLPKSISTKKAKLEEAPTKSTPQQSLAEYLAAAFNDAAGKDAVNDKSGT